MRAEKMWNVFLEKHAVCDSEFTEEYAKLYGDAYSLVEECGGSFAILIILENSKFKDFETPYGYGSFYTNSNDKSFNDKFFSDVFDFLKKRQIVCGFIRFNPSYYLPENTSFESVYVRKTVYVNLDDDFENGIKARTKSAIKTGIKNNLLISDSCSEEDFEKFYILYDENIKKKNPSGELLFDKKYFLNMASHKIFHLISAADENGEFVGGSIFIIKENSSSYYHLSIVKDNGLYKGVSSFLLYKGLLLAKSMKSPIMNLGGGLTDNRDDSLFFFKSSFSSNSKNFYIGKMIIDNEKYNKLIEEYDKKHQNGSNLFLRYRY